MPAGSLSIVGTGIRLSQLTTETRAYIETAGKLLFLVCDPVTFSWLTQVNPTAESLDIFYSESKLREKTYAEMVDRILSCVREGLEVCVALYGHPGVFAYPGHEAIRRARLEGYSARMFPGISAEDCLFADLGIDPGTNGCQSFEATDFLMSGRQFDPRTPMLLWQIAVCGYMGHRMDCSVSGLRVLVEVLLRHFDGSHEVVIYEASKYPGLEPTIQRVPLAKVPEAKVIPSSTLYVPPNAKAIRDVAMARRLGMPPSYFVQNSDSPDKPLEE
jgi:uncharacterized protein YabN with tetrapyrrole methylase and pyrophosphatase domain